MNTSTVDQQQSTSINLPLNTIDQQTLINALNNGAGLGGQTVIATTGQGQSMGGGGGNVQYYFALPANGLQNGSGGGGGGNGIPLQIQGLQNIQGIQNIQTIQGLQGLQGLQGAQIILNSNGQPTIYVGNRDC